MKKQLILSTMAAVCMLAACNDETSTTKDAGAKQDTMVNATTTTETPVNTTDDFASRSFTDLKTGEPLSIRRDTVSYKYVNVKTGKEPGYYYDKVSHDTFDSRGYIINNSLINNNGEYSIDEDKIMVNPENLKIKENESKVKIDDGDMKIKDETGKIKQDDNKYKEKTEDSKVKVTDDKMKVKSK